MNKITLALIITGLTGLFIAAVAAPQPWEFRTVDPGDTLERVAFLPVPGDDSPYRFLETSDSLDGEWNAVLLDDPVEDEHGMAVTSIPAGAIHARIRERGPVEEGEDWPLVLEAERTETEVTARIRITGGYGAGVRWVVEQVPEAAPTWETSDDATDAATTAVMDRLDELLRTLPPAQGDEYSVTREIAE